MIEVSEQAPDNLSCSPNESSSDQSPWLRARTRKQRSKHSKNPPPILRCSASQRPDGVRPPGGLTDLVEDDDLPTLRQKFNKTRDYFLHTGTGQHCLASLCTDLDMALSGVNNEPDTVDVLCLGLGNPAVDRASLRQLALLDVLIERDGRLTRAKTRLYDPVFRQVARDMISELGMKVIPTNEEAHYTLTNDRHHFILLPHCSPILLDNLLSSNWSQQVIQRIVLCSNSWKEVRRELLATGESDCLISNQLACIHTLHPALCVGQWNHSGGGGTGRPRSRKEEPDFEGMRIQWFPANRLSQLPPTVWVGPPGSELCATKNSEDPVRTRLSEKEYRFGADLIDKNAVSCFVDQDRSCD